MKNANFDLMKFDPLIIPSFFGALIFRHSFLSGGELLELRLLEKTARHVFIIARHRSSS